MDALMGGMGLGFPQPAMGALPGLAPLGAPMMGLPGGGLEAPRPDGFMASPELSEGALGGSAHPWGSGKTGFEGLDVAMPGMDGGMGGLGGGIPDMSALMGGMPDMTGMMGGMPGLDMGMGGLDMGMGGGSLANQAAGLQSGLMDNNLANAALLGAEAVGQKNGAQQGQILGDAATLGLA